MNGLLRKTLIRAALAWEWLESGATFNPLSKQARRNPYPMYERLRSKDPVHRSRLANGWVLTRYADIKAVLSDHRRFSNDDRKARRGPLLSGSRVSETPSIVGLDPPEHTRLRRLVGKAFTPNAVERYRPTIHMIANELAGHIDDSGPFDIVSSFARPMPLLVMCQIMGLPQDGVEQFAEWIEDVEMLLIPKAATKPVERLRKSRDDLTTYLHGIAIERRKNPKADLITELVAAENRGEINNDELRVMMVFLLGAGTSSTTAVIGNALFHLLSGGFELARFCEDPKVMSDVIDELIRFEPPVQFNRRIALEDVKLGDKEVRQGDHLMLLHGGAAHDQDIFPEAELLMVGRSPSDHLAFGRGIHYCIGATLARTELNTALMALMCRFKHLEIVGQPHYSETLLIRRPTSLYVQAKPIDREQTRDTECSDLVA